MRLARQLCNARDRWGAFSETVARAARGLERKEYAAFTATAKVTLSLAGVGLGSAVALIDCRGFESANLLTLTTTVQAAGAVMIIFTGLIWLKPECNRPVPKTE